MSDVPEARATMADQLATIEQFFRMKASAQEILDMDLIVLRHDLSDAERTRLVTELVRGTTTGSKSS
ncbi:MAG: hypothetical protein WC617_12525 [Rhodanobacter sp.]|jgi:hypothetical protein